MTEIGLKSKVFSSIRGANINGIPTKEALDDIYQDKVNFQLGQVDLFIKRFSFVLFKITSVFISICFFKTLNI